MSGRRLAAVAARRRASLGLLNARNGAGSQLMQCRAYGQPLGGAPGTAGQCLDRAAAAAESLPAAAHAAPLLHGAGRRAAGAQHAHCRPYSQVPAEYKGLYTGKVAVPKPRPAAPAAELSAAAEAPPGAPEPARPHAPLTAAEQKASAEAGSAGPAAGSPLRAWQVSRNSGAFRFLGLSRRLEQALVVLCLRHRPEGTKLSCKLASAQRVRQCWAGDSQASVGVYERQAPRRCQTPPCSSGWTEAAQVRQAGSSGSPALVLHAAWSGPRAPGALAARASRAADGAPCGARSVGVDVPLGAAADGGQRPAAHMGEGVLGPVRGRHGGPAVHTPADARGEEARPQGARAPAPAPRSAPRRAS